MRLQPLPEDGRAIDSKIKLLRDPHRERKKEAVRQLVRLWTTDIMSIDLLRQGCERFIRDVVLGAGGHTQQLELLSRWVVGRLESLDPVTLKEQWLPTLLTTRQT